MQAFQPYAQGEAAQTLLGALGNARLAAQQHYRDITALAQRGEPITDAVLLKLLPYADTPRQRLRSAWLHPAPAIVGDLRSWYEAAGWTQPDEWLAIASAILNFVRQSMDDPRGLAAACRSFRLLPYTTGFQSGILSPILNALRPKQYRLFNQQMRRTLNYFTDSSFTQALTDYPAANAALHALLTELSALPVWQTLPATQRTDYFLLFCHWLVKEQDFSFRPCRYWLHAVAEDRWLWQEWREGNMITIGWDELGDPSGVRKREFSQRRDSLIAQHPTWRKGNAEQVWRFARQMQEGDLVLVHDGKTILGTGTICGPHYYVVELPLGHRHPVEWTDVTPRLLPAGMASAELVAVTAEAFATLATAPAVVPSIVTPSQTEEAGASLPDFVRFLAPLVNTLQIMGGSGRASEVVAAMLTQIADTQTQPDAVERDRQQIYRARRLLLRAGLLDSAQRGLWQLTAAGMALVLTETQAAALFTETLYQQRLSASLRSESTTMRRLAETPVPYTTDTTSATAPPDVTDQAAIVPSQAVLPESAAPPQTIAAALPAYPLVACAAATFIPEETLARWDKGGGD